MTTLLSIYAKGAGCVGFCSARCYNAMPPSDLRGRGEGERYMKDSRVCDCICGGMNHAVGLTKALKNRDRLFPMKHANIDQWAAIHHRQSDDLVVVDRLRVRDYRAARRIADAAFEPQAPLPLFQCEALADTQDTHPHPPSAIGVRRGTATNTVFPPDDPP